MTIANIDTESTIANAYQYQVGDDIETASSRTTAAPPLSQEEDVTTDSLMTVTHHTVETLPESSPDDSNDDDERTRHWKSHPYAVGLVDIDWSGGNARNKWACPLMFSYLCCKRAGRIGNMVVLYETSTSSNDSQNGNDDPTTTISRPVIMVGPHWPMMVCVTYPIIFGVSLATFVLEIRNQHVALVAIWSVMTILLILALAGVACRNPGIFRRHAEVPEGEEWIWNDQGKTFRPRKAKYDSECAVVVDGYDHTCPWTGTAIGKNNMRAFQCFVVLVGAMLLFDVTLLAAPI
jgi:hypothetical protein